MERCGEGLYGRPPSLHIPPTVSLTKHDVAGAGHTVPQTVSIKAHSTHPDHPRPHGILDWRLGLMRITADLSAPGTPLYTRINLLKLIIEGPTLAVIRSPLYPRRAYHSALLYST